MASNDSLETEFLPMKFKIILVLILYLMFLVFMQGIWIFLTNFGDNQVEGYYFFLGFALAFFLGVMGMMILSMFGFHINDRIEQGMPYFRDKESYRHMMLTGSFFFFLIILSIIGFSVFSSEDFRYFGLFFGYIAIGTGLAWIIGYFRKRKKLQTDGILN